jgi:hypothetical protein
MSTVIASAAPPESFAVVTDYADVPLERLEAELCQGAANLTAAEHTWLLQLAEFDRRLGWEAWDCHSCAHWLTWQVGLDRRTARDKVRVAKALVEFPLISEAMRAGHLSYSKVRAITRVAVPETERPLLDMALAGTTNHVERGLTHRVNDDGTLTITLTLPTEGGVAYLSAVESYAAPAAPDIDGRIVSRASRLADAALAMAEVAVAVADEQRPSAPPRFLVQLHHGDGVREVEGVGDALDTPLAVSEATAERLMCDAYAEHVYHDDDGEVTAVSNRASVIRGRLRRLVQARDRTCRVPGCGRRGRDEIHHLHHRGKGGNNARHNLMLVCRYHHHLLHEGGWTAVHSPDGVEFHLPDGRVISPIPTLLTGHPDPVAAAGLSADDGRCQWTGDELDLDMALTCLFSHQPWVDPWRYAPDPQRFS